MRRLHAAATTFNDWFIEARPCRKEVLVRTDVELGIDDGYTRAGVEALLGGAAANTPTTSTFTST